MIKKMWVKFDDLDVECFCDYHHRKCTSKKCKPFVVKFIDISEEVREEKVIQEFDKAAKKFQSELVKTLKVMDKIKK